MEKILLLVTITQIIIESLPISSSGHVMLVLILVQKIWQKQDFFLPDLLDPLLHTSAIIAILITFHRDWYPPVKHLLNVFAKLCTQQKLKFSQQKLMLIFFKITGLIFTADIITALFYFLFKTTLKNHWVTSSSITLLFGFCCTALILFSIAVKQKFFTTSSKPLTFKTTLILGIIQGLALIPGISRFASTYAMGCWLNLGPRRAFQISFLLHLPLIIPDILVHGLIPLSKNSGLLSIFDKNFLILSLISTTTATLLLMLTYKLAIKNKLWLFCFYMFIPIVVLIFLILNS